MIAYHRRPGATEERNDSNRRVARTTAHNRTKWHTCKSCANEGHRRKAPGKRASGGVSCRSRGNPCVQLDVQQSRELHGCPTHAYAYISPHAMSCAMHSCPPVTADQFSVFGGPGISQTTVTITSTTATIVMFPKVWTVR